MDAEKYNELDMQNLEDTCDAAIVPIELVRTVLSDSKRMLAKQREQEKSIHDLTFTAQRQKMKIKELETMCREMYNGSVPDASTESQRDVPVNRLQEIEEKSPVRPGAVRTLSARSSSKRLMKRRSSTIHTESSLGSVGFDQLTDKLRKYTHMQEQNEEFKKVLHATRMISTKKSLDDAVNTIVSSACKLLNCSAVSMYIVEPRNRFYTVTSAIREDPSAEPHILNERTIRTTIAPSIVSRVIVSRNKETISLVSAHTLYSPEIDNPVQIPIDTMMCVPIVDVSGVQVLAVLQALNKFPGLDISQTPEMDNDESFTENDETIMANVAESATNALHALRLNNESKLAQARITGLLHMLQDVAEGTTAYEVIDRIVRGSSREILEAERLSYFSLSLDKQHLILNHSMDAQGIRISINSGVAGYVARTGKDLIIMDAYSDDRFDKSTDEKTGFVTRSIMCMPVRKTENDEVLGVIQAINKVNRGTFDPIDTELLRYIARSAAISMHRSMLHDQLIQAKNFTEARMRISNVSVRNVGIDVVTHVVMDAARLFIDVEATTLFLVDRSKSELWVTGIQGVNSLRIPIGVGLAGKCAQTGEKIVITDAYDDPTFNRSFDLKTGFRTKSVLCVPIMEQRKFQSESEQNAPPENRVVAVFQAINRVHDGRVIAFNDADIKIFDEFCSEVAIVLHQVSMETTCLKIFADSSKSGKDGLAQASLLSMYTASPLSLTDTPGEEVKKRRRGQIFSISSGSGSSNESFDNLSNWESDILALTHREMFSFIQQVFRKYKLYEAFSMPIALLQNFLETVRLKYRDNPFHNFHHGFHCFQSAFLMISSDVIKNAAFLDSLDIFGLLTAALCHDIDHPGHNNAFEVNSHSSLAILHNDDAVLERHHARTTFLVLQNENCNIFHNLTRHEFIGTRKLIIRAILSTDMQNHFTHIRTIDNLAQMDLATLTDEDKQSFIDVIVHSSDLSGQVVSQAFALKWGDRIVEEFTNQVIKEERLSLPVLPFMKDLETATQCAKMQLSFCTYVLLPLWKALRNLIPETAICLRNLESNMSYYRIESNPIEQSADISIGED